MARVKTVYKKDYNRARLDRFGNFHKSGSVEGMKKLFYGKDALLVKCGSWIYNVNDEVYYGIAH